MARMLGDSHFWNSWYCGWRPTPEWVFGRWPKSVQVAFKRRQRRRERQQWRKEEEPPVGGSSFV
jgi:hypothetical protein